VSAIEPGTTFGTYRIESALGRGGMSVVYLAEDPRLARRVAIKVLAPELADDETFRNRFIRESQLAAGLDHPNIVPVYEAGEVDGRLFIAMRYVKGIDLRSMIARDGRLTPDRTARLVRPVAGALDAAHRRGLVHRDVKPANILIALDQDEEHPYLSDFGLTKHTSSKSGLTKTGTFMGTVDYVAPEQIQGAVVDGRTDEYSLACVVYQCLTGAVPFDKETEVATLFAHLQDPLPKVSVGRSDIAEDLDEVVARGMAKDREERYPTCTAMMDAFVETVGLPHTREPVPFDPTVVAAPPPQQPDSGPLLPPAPEAAAAAASASTPPIERPAAEPRPEPAGPAAPPRKGSSRLAAIIGGSLLGLAAVVVAIVLLTGGEEGPGPGPNPTNGTGTTGPTVVSPLELSGGSVVDIPPRGTGVPYPSTIRVSDVEGVVTDVNVTLDGFRHGFPNDLDVLLVGPGGQSVVLAEGVGGAEPVQDVTITFDDDGVPLTDQQAPSDETTFRPSSNAGDGFGFNGPGAVPPPPHGSALGVFDGTDPNGTWSLFVFDDGPRDAGQIAGGWSLELELAGQDEVFFADDMSDPGSGWPVFDESGSYGLYRDGTYVLGLPGAFEVSARINTTSDLSSLTDVRVEATGRLLGSRNALYGVLCRASSQFDYYYFLVQGDGTYYIGESVGGTATNFASAFTPAIVRGEAPNRIAAECFDEAGGVSLQLFVNGIPVDAVVDSTQPFTRGTIGVRAEARRGPMEAAFDDVLVTAPVGGPGGG
jgi:subtilisin-like proprotein convertase family protein